MGAYAVTCFTCGDKIMEGDLPPDDGQALLTNHAEAKCQRADCPHKTAAVAAAAQYRPATLGDINTIRGRLDKLEAKVKP